MDFDSLVKRHAVEPLTYAAYLGLIAAKAEATAPAGAAEAPERLEYTRLIRHRSQRIARIWPPPDELPALLRDANPGAVDRFLTDGERAIPIVAMFGAADHTLVAGFRALTAARRDRP